MEYFATGPGFEPGLSVPDSYIIEPQCPYCPYEAFFSTIWDFDVHYIHNFNFVQGRFTTVVPSTELEGRLSL
jgi:hypothetical protein